LMGGEFSVRPLMNENLRKMAKLSLG